MQRKGLGLFIGVLAAVGASIPALADTTPEDAKDYRASIMTVLRGHVGAASMIARGLVDNNGQLEAHADGLVNAAAELENIFPEGSNVEGSESLPAIWENPEEFQAAIDKLVTAAANFKEVAGSGDRAAIGGAFREVGLSCRGCHDNFRQSN